MSFLDGAASLPDSARSLISGAVITATSKASAFSMRALSAAEVSNLTRSVQPVAFSSCGCSSWINALVALELRTVSACCATAGEAISTVTTAIRTRIAPLRRLFYAVVRRFLGDGHVVHVAFAEAGVGDADNLGIPLQIGNRCGAAI